jgi:hypothetical protein
MKEVPVKIPMFVGVGVMTKAWREWFSDLYISSKSLRLPFRSEPADPKNGSAVLWLNSSGDLQIKITDNSGVTKETTIVDFSLL